MKDKNKTKEQLIEELKEAKDELELQAWGLKKTNDGIKLLYKELEEKTKRLQELDRLKSDFISTVSHELRTPLAITKEGIGLVLDEIPGKINEKQQKILTTARNNIDRLARIINNLLDMSKIEAGKIGLKKELINIRSLIQQLTFSFEPKVKDKGLELKVNLPKEEIDIYVDADRVMQVFTNLVYNAIKFTKVGFIEVSVRQKDSEVECSVADTGIGISKKDLPEVFSKFRQFGRTADAGEKGTGLGLSIAKGIIDMHGGRIWLESEFGKGTKFTFTLPKYNAEMLFREYLDNGIKEAIEKDTRLSLIVVSIAEMSKLRQKFPDGEIQSILKDIEDILKNSLRRERNVALQVSGEVIILLSDCNKKKALRVESRLEQLLDDYLRAERLVDRVKLRFGCASYPDEVGNAEELVKKAKKT